MEVCSVCGVDVNEFNRGIEIGGKPTCAGCRREFDGIVPAEPSPRPVQKEHPKELPHYLPLELPDYAAAELLMILLRVIGVVDLIGGILLGLATFLRAEFLRADHFSDAGYGFLIIIGAVASCVLFFGLSQLIACMRDMAINSFHIRNNTGSIKT